MSLGAQLSQHRRHRIAYVALLRRSTRYSRRTWSLRIIAICLVMFLSLPSRAAVPAVLLCLIACLGSGLMWINQRHRSRGTQPRFWLSKLYSRSMTSSDGRHRLGLGTYLDITVAFVLIAIPTWVTPDNPTWARLLMLTGGVSFLISTALVIFNDHTWFNPDEPDPPAWHEITRRVAGPLVTGLICLEVLPAQWGEDAIYAVLAIAMLYPMTMSLRISDTDLIMKPLPAVVLEEAHAGRELVLAETHGALSTHLRLLEQQAREIRHLAPSVYELAVGANSRLRETLTLGEAGLETSTSVQSLQAPIATLARAVGAKAVIEITVTRLIPIDRDLARLVLNDLVGNALNAGACELEVTVSQLGRHVVIAVTDDAAPMAVGMWKAANTSSARLEGRLTELGGSLLVKEHPTTKTVSAAWLPRTS